MSFFSKNDDPELSMAKQQLKLQEEQHAMASGDNIDESVFMANQEKKEDLLRWQQSILDELEELKWMLRGYRFDEDKGWYKRDEDPALMNESGIRMVDLSCRPLLSRNLINSNLEESMILGMLRRTADSITLNIAYYGISDYKMDFGNYSLVTRLIKNTIIPTPFRALGGWNKRQDNLMSKRVEAFQDTNAGNNKKSIFGVFG